MNCFVRWYYCEHIFGRGKKMCIADWSSEGKKQHFALSFTSFSVEEVARRVIIKENEQVPEKSRKAKCYQIIISFTLFEIITKKHSLGIRRQTSIGRFLWQLEGGCCPLCKFLTLVAEIRYDKLLQNTSVRKKKEIIIQNNELFKTSDC